MSNDAHIVEPVAPSQGAEPHAADPRIAVAEMWLCMLGGLMEVAKRFCRFLIREMIPYKRGPEGQILALRYSGDPGAAFKRVVRIARFAAFLSLKIQAQIAAWKAGEPFDIDAFLAQTPLPRALSRSRRDANDGDDEDLEDFEEWEDLEEFENLMEREAPERFDILDGSERAVKEDKYVTLLKGPLKDAIAAICKDLGLKPDWSLWTANGFPAPAGGGVEDWVAFFVPAPAVAPAPRPRERPYMGPPPPDPADKAAYETWRRKWCPPDRRGASAPSYRTPIRPPDLGGSPGQPLGISTTNGLSRAATAPDR